MKMDLALMSDFLDNRIKGKNSFIQGFLLHPILYKEKISPLISENNNNIN